MRAHIARVVVFGSAAVLLVCVLLAGICRGQAFSAPAGQYRVENGQAVLNGGCGPNGCPGGACPAPQPWQQAPPRYQRPMEPLQPQSPQASSNPAVCRIKVPDGRGAAYYGTGTLVDVGEGYGLVVTAAHVLRGGTGKPTCVFSDGREFAGSPVNDKDGKDIAAILIQDPGIKPVEVLATSVGRGATVVSGGFGGDGRYLVRSGVIVRVDGDSVEVSGTARQGDSGGPILNQQGQLVGVLWGTGGGVTVGTTATRTDVFLQRAGRYLLPWNAKINDPARDPNNQPQPLPPQPPVIVPQQPPTDLSGVNGALAQHDARIADLERRQDKVRDTAEALAAKYEKELPGLSADVKAAIDGTKAAETKAVDAKKAVDEATDEDNPKGIIGKIKAKIEERFGGVLGEVSWLKYGGIGLGALLAFFLWDLRQKVKTGDPLLIEKVVDKVHEKVAPKLEGTRAGEVESKVYNRLEAMQARIDALISARFPQSGNPPSGT